MMDNRGLQNVLSLLWQS